MRSTKEWCLLVIFLLLELKKIIVFGNKITTDVGAGLRECFFYEIDNGTTFEIEYQVRRGGNFDISFALVDPRNQILIADMRRTMKSHRFTAASSGPYQFCLDNSFSRTSNKVVTFNIYSKKFKKSTLERFPHFNEVLDKDLESLKSPLFKIHTNLESSMHYQSLFAAIEARDRSIIENNFESVNFWSTVHVCVMLLSVAINSIVIRKLFTDSKKFK